VTTSSAYLFAEDLLDEGYSAVAARLREAGIDSATIAAAYHHARDVFPHGVHRKVQQLEGGVCYFQPRRSLYGRIQPVAASVIGDSEPLAALAEHIPFSTWLVVLHNSRLAEAYPDCAPQTAFGDRLLNSLCPAHPQVREFAVALAQDVARYEPRAIKLEAVHYMGFDHGGHHERSFVPLSPNVRFLLGLCFCSHCVAAAPDVDVSLLQRTVSHRLDRVFASSDAETHEASPDDLALQELLGGYVQARERTVASLVAEIAKAVDKASRVVYLDPSGATLGYATGKPATERSAVSIGWRDGIDLDRIARHVDGLGMLGYFADAARFSRELETYLEVAPAERLEVILRPMAPDTESATQLQERVRLLRQRGVQQVSFYHYGFMRLENLDWVASALRV
jgi:hypothetical protein